MNVGFDADTEVLELILSGKVSGSPVGIYLDELKKRFEGAVVVDMLATCACTGTFTAREGLLMMREAGFPVTLDAADRAKLDELDFSRRASERPAASRWPRSSGARRAPRQIFMMRDEAPRSGVR